MINNLTNPKYILPELPGAKRKFASTICTNPVWLKFKIERPLDDETPATPAN